MQKMLYIMSLYDDNEPSRDAKPKPGVIMSQATAERRKQIMSQLLEHKQVTVKELAASMEVSDATVRRDLKALADEQGLKLIHGGAALPRERDFSFQARAAASDDEKKIIGGAGERAAAGWRPCVPRLRHDMLGAGAFVKRMHEITVLTNSAGWRWSWMRRACSCS